MAGEYKATCGCKIHVMQWSTKRKIVTQESCPLHKAAPDLLEALQNAKAMLRPETPRELWEEIETAIAKAEGQ